MAKPKLLLEAHLKALRLPTFLREYDKVARQCAQEGLDCPRYLLRLSELELLDREQRATERRIKAAKFPVLKSLETFEFRSIPSLNKSLVLELARSEYLDRRENVLALGNSGTGKTHIALALGLAACQKGYRVRFTTAAALVNELLEARDEKRLLRFQKQLAKQDLLIVDELGYVPLSKTGALLDRLPHHVPMLEMNGDSHRLELHEQVVELNRRGFSQQAIAAQLDLDRKTVRRWLRSDGFPERKTAERSSLLNRFRPYLEARWRNGCHNGAQLWREIQGRGHQGGRGMVAQLVARWRREGLEAAPKSPMSAAGQGISPRQAAVLVTRRAESLRPEEERLIADLSKACPDVLRMRAIAEGFRTALESGQPSLLKAWMSDIPNDAFPSIAQFAAGLERDWQAVAAAVALPWSNGPRRTRKSAQAHQAPDVRSGRV